MVGKLKMEKKRKFECGYCGRMRYVYTYPRSNCWCIFDKPNKYLMLRWQIIQWVKYLWQQLFFKFYYKWYWHTAGIKIGWSEIFKTSPKLIRKKLKKMEEEDEI